MHPALVIGFALAVAPLTLTPGASFTLTVSYASQGPRAVGNVITGTGLGIFTHGLLAAIGLSAIVMRSAEIYRAVQIAGAAYLIWLGIAMLRSAHYKRTRHAAPFDLARGRGPLATAYVANVLNPKAAGVYLTLVPQFIAPDSMNVTTMSILAATHVVVMALWLGCVGVALGAVTRRVGVQRLIAAIQRVGALVLVALGVRACAEAVA